MCGQRPRWLAGRVAEGKNREQGRETEVGPVKKGKRDDKTRELLELLAVGVVVSLSLFLGLVLWLLAESVVK